MNTTQIVAENMANYVGKYCMVFSKNGRGRHFVKIIDQSECGRFVKVTSTGAFFGNRRWKAS